MSDKDWVTKGAVKELVKRILMQPGDETWRKYCSVLEKAINRLPAVEIKSPEEIERAIKYLDEEDCYSTTDGSGRKKILRWSSRECADLLRLVRGRPQKTWGEKIFGESTEKL